MKERAVAEWKVSGSMPWTGVVAGGVILAVVLTLFSHITPIALGVCIGAGMVIVASAIHLVRRALRPRRIAALKRSSLPVKARIAGSKVVRKFDIDLSPLSLLDGSSGISFPKVVIFEAHDEHKKIYLSQPTNVPLELAERYLGKPVLVYNTTGSSDSYYVDIETLPTFDPLDAMRNILKRK